MTRAARAVLIAVPETARAKGAVSRAIPTADALGAFLERRFDETTIVRVTPETGPVTKAAVLDAFERARPAGGELFVVLFFGHGLPADDDHPYQGWALTTEELTDLELAAALHRLPDGVDTVVISNCCYGRGFLNAGPRTSGQGPRIPRSPLRQLSRAFSDRLHCAASAPMVCISAAASSARGSIVLRAAAGQLVTEVTAAAEQRLSYAALGERFQRRRSAGRAFHVDARPPERLADVVLGA